MKSLIATIVFMLLAAPAAADSIDSIATGHGLRSMPIGREFFCKEHPSWCSGLPQTKPLKMTKGLMDQLSRVNREVNAAITYKPDTLRPVPVKNRPGESVMVERWSIDPKTGDCEDYAVSKLSHLIDIGIPRSALRLAIYRLPSGAYHSVLTVDVDDNTMVLSNLTDKVLPWREVPDADWIGVERVSPHGFMGFWQLREASDD